MDKMLQWTFWWGQNVTVDVVNLDVTSRQRVGGRNAGIWGGGSGGGRTSPISILQKKLTKIVLLSFPYTRQVLYYNLLHLTVLTPSYWWQSVPYLNSPKPYVLYPTVLTLHTGMSNLTWPISRAVSLGRASKRQIHIYILTTRQPTFPSFLLT
jgi:hypothetical protein